jgi:hypothetical protein
MEVGQWFSGSTPNLSLDPLPRVAMKSEALVLMARGSHLLDLLNSLFPTFNKAYNADSTIVSSWSERRRALSALGQALTRISGHTHCGGRDV